MDLSKAFDTLNHELLIAKLHVYGFKPDALSLIYSYLSNRWQRTKINTSFSTWAELLSGVPQGSVLGPLHFNIFINDLFYIFDDINVCNHADYTSLYACDISLKILTDTLEYAANNAVVWFKYNYMKLNLGKCHLLICGDNEECILANIGSELVIESHHKTLLGVLIDSKLKFENHVKNLYKKAGKKLNALGSQCNILPFHKRRILMNSFFNSKCLLVEN